MSVLGTHLGSALCRACNMCPLQRACACPIMPAHHSKPLPDVLPQKLALFHGVRREQPPPRACSTASSSSSSSSSSSGRYRARGRQGLRQRAFKLSDGRLVTKTSSLPQQLSLWFHLHNLEIYLHNSHTAHCHLTTWLRCGACMRAPPPRLPFVPYCVPPRPLTHR